MPKHQLHHTEYIVAIIQQAETFCREKGLRLTAIRRRVLNIIWQTYQPIKAYDILKQLSDNAKPPTVYRALDFLLKHGLAHKISSLNAFVGCSHPNTHPACYFLICTRCGNAEECCTHKLNDVINNAAKNVRFKVSHITLEIAGICRQCQ